MDIDVTFRIEDERFVQLTTYLTRMIDGRVCCEA